MPNVDFTLEDIRRVVDVSIDARFKMFEENYEKDMMAIQQDFLAIYRRFDAMDSRFDAMDERFDAMDERFDAMDERFDAMDSRFDRLDGEFTLSKRVQRKHSADIVALQAAQGV